MPNSPNSNSQSNTGSMGGGQQIAQGSNSKLTMEINSNAASNEQTLNQTDVAQLLTEIEDMIDAAMLPTDIKDEVSAYLSAAKKATSKDEPKKDVAIVNLKSMTETLEDAGRTLDVSKNLFIKVKPILEKLATWLGVAAGTLFSSLV